MKFGSCHHPKGGIFVQNLFNLADLLCRGIADHLRNNENIWFKGFEFLCKREDQWLMDPVNEPSIAYDEAVKSPCHVVHSLTVESTETESKKSDITPVIDVDRFGNYKKLL